MKVLGRQTEPLWIGTAFHTRVSRAHYVKNWKKIEIFESKIHATHNDSSAWSFFQRSAFATTQTNVLPWVRGSCAYTEIKEPPPGWLTWNSWQHNCLMTQKISIFKYFNLILLFKMFTKEKRWVVFSALFFSPASSRSNYHFVRLQADRAVLLASTALAGFLSTSRS